MQHFNFSLKAPPLLFLVSILMFRVRTMYLYTLYSALYCVIVSFSPSLNISPMLIFKMYFITFLISSRCEQHVVKFQLRIVLFNLF